MDALIVEDGTGVPNANTFIDRAYLINYASNMGFTIDDEDESNVFIFKAMVYLLIQNYKGDPVFIDGLPFPRMNVEFGDTIPPFVIPERLKKAEAQLALDISNGFDPLPNIGAGSSSQIVTSEKIGPLSRTYLTSGAAFDRVVPLMPIANGFLAPLLVGNGAFGLTVRKA